MSRFVASVATIAIGLVIGLFVFFAVTESLAVKDDPRHVTLDNGSTVNYYDPSKHTSADSAAASATEVARAFAIADERAASRHP